MSSALCNLLRDNTLFKYAGINKDTVEAHADYCNDYLSAKFGVGAVKSAGDKFIKKEAILDAGEVVKLIANCGKVKPYKYKTVVSVNPELQKYGFFSSPSILEEGDDCPIVVSLMLTKDIEVGKMIKDLDHLIRVSVLD